MPKHNFPEKIPIFPLSGVVFFPNTTLPLNIFESRYIQLVNDCMKSHKLFGMVLPKLKKERQTEFFELLFNFLLNQDLVEELFNFILQKLINRNTKYFT